MELVEAAIRRHRFAYSNEAVLQEGLAQALEQAGLEVLREVRLDARSRVDLLVGGVAVEVKVAGSTAALLRQIRRYAAHDRVEGVLVVSGRVRHLRLPTAVCGKPVRVVTLAAAGL